MNKAIFVDGPLKGRLEVDVKSPTPFFEYMTYPEISWKPFEPSVDTPSRIVYNAYYRIIDGEDFIYLYSFQDQ